MAGFVRRVLGALWRALSCPSLSRGKVPPSQREASDLDGFALALGARTRCRRCGAPFVRVGPEAWQCETVAFRSDDEARKHGWAGRGWDRSTLISRAEIGRN